MLKRLFVAILILISLPVLVKGEEKDRFIPEFKYQRGETLCYSFEMKGSLTTPHWCGGYLAQKPISMYYEFNEEVLSVNPGEGATLSVSLVTFRSMFDNNIQPTPKEWQNPRQKWKGIRGSGVSASDTLPLDGLQFHSGGLCVGSEWEISFSPKKGASDTYTLRGKVVKRETSKTQDKILLDTTLEFTIHKEDQSYQGTSKCSTWFSLKDGHILSAKGGGEAWGTLNEHPGRFIRKLNGRSFTSNNWFSLANFELKLLKLTKGK